MSYISVATPVIVSILVFALWIIVRHLFYKLPEKPAWNFFGIFIIFLVCIVSGWLPLGVSDYIVFHFKSGPREFGGDRLWPSLLCSVFVWICGALYIIYIAVESVILRKHLQGVAQSRFLRRLLWLIFIVGVCLVWFAFF